MTSLRNLKALRQARGWTQQELSQKSGVKLDAIQKQEQGARDDAFLSIAYPLARCLGVSIEALFLPASSHETLDAAS